MSKDDEDQDLDFWMDSDTNSNINDISDDDSQIEAVISPNSKNAKNKSPNSKFKKKKRPIVNNTINDDDEDDDVVVISETPRRGSIPKEFTEELTPFENHYEPPIAKSKESQALEYAVESLKNDINKMLHADDDDDDDNVGIAPVSAPILKKEGDLTLIFVFPSEDFQEERILKAGQSFITAFQTLPERFEDYSVQIDGVTYDPKEVLPEILVDYTKVVLVEPDQSGSLKGFKKLSFVLPSSEKKKLALDPNSTFKEILIKLGIPNGKLMFDGEQIPLNQKISENDDLEDGDQIDVCY